MNTRLCGQAAACGQFHYVQSIACKSDSTADLKIHRKSAALLIIQLKCIFLKIADDVPTPPTLPAAVLQCC